MDESNSFADGPRLRKDLLAFNPAIVLTSDDFNQLTVPSMGSLTLGSPQSNAIEVSRSAAQIREDFLLGTTPQTAAATKRTVDAALLQPLAVICRLDYDRLEKIVGVSRSTTSNRAYDLVQELFSEHPYLQGLVALSPKMLPKFLAASFSAHQSGTPSSISTGDFPGITIASFQCNPIDPLTTTNKYVLQAFTKTKYIEQAVSYLVMILNMFAYGEVKPDYSVWSLMFSHYCDQLKNQIKNCAAMEPGNKCSTIIVHLLNKSLLTFAASLNDVKYYEYTDRQWIDYGRSLFRYDDAKVIAEGTGTAQLPLPQFSNWVTWKKVVPVITPAINPILDVAKKKKQAEKRKNEDVLPSPNKERKVKEAKKDQICISHFQFVEGLKSNACNNKKNNGNCERKHLPKPANGVKWDKSVLDKILEVANSFENGATKDSILAHLITLR